MQVFYRVNDEVRPKADIVLVKAAKRLVRQLFTYQARHNAISHFYAEQGRRVLKAEIIAKDLNLKKEEYMTVRNLSFYSLWS
jgi:hypothetical protein